MRETILTGAELDGEEQFDKSLRPSHFKDFSGQLKIKENLDVYVKSALMRGKNLDHTLFHGPPGLGKTTLANILASELGVGIKMTSGPVLEKAADLAGLLTNLNENDILFIDEIHRLSPVIEEYLYPAMEDFKIDIMLSDGPSANSVQLNLPPFTLVGATTKAGSLTSPLRARFGIICRMVYYSPEELFKIVKRSASIMNVKIDDAGALELSRRSRGTPRIANRILRRVRDYALVRADGIINKDTADAGLLSLDIDHAGLDDMDRAILTAMIDKFDGGPVGIKNIAVSVGEEPSTIEEVYEPYLIQEGYLKRTPRGRCVTNKTYKHYGYQREGNSSLFCKN